MAAVAVISVAEAAVTSVAEVVESTPGWTESSATSSYQSGVQVGTEANTAAAGRQSNELRAGPLPGDGYRRSGRR